MLFTTLDEGTAGYELLLLITSGDPPDWRKMETWRRLALGDFERRLPIALAIPSRYRQDAIAAIPPSRHEEVLLWEEPLRLGARLLQQGQVLAAAEGPPVESIWEPFAAAVESALAAVR